MKKVVLVLGIAIVLLAGCDYIGNNSDKKSEEKSTSVVLTESESNSKQSTATASSVTTKAENKQEKEPITFVPQNDETDKGLTIENDETLAKLQKIVDENQDMGFEDDITIVYSGQTFGETSNLAGIFFIVNRTDKSLKNMKFTYTFGGIDRQLIFDQKAFALSEEKFGTLEPNTVMPMYFPIEPENEMAFKEIDATQVIEKIDTFNYDTADNNTDSSGKEPATSEDELTFKIPKQNSDKGQTIENNQLMANLKQLVDENPSIGFENDVTVLYSQLHEKSEDQLLAYFFIINRTNTTMENLSFIFNYGNKNGEKVWDREQYRISSEVFGTFEPFTVIPMTMEVPAGKEELFLSITEKNIQTSIENFHYEKVN